MTKRASKSSLLFSREIAQQQQPSASPQEIAAQVLHSLRTEAASEAAIHKFAGRHQEVFNDKRLGFLAVAELVPMCLEEMRAIGVSEQDLQMLSQDPTQAVAWHRDLRGQGYQLSSGDAIAERAIQSVERDFVHRSAPQSQGGQSTRTEARQQEKRDLQNQPRRASAIARQAPPAPQTVTNIVSDQRARRGFRT